MKALHTTLFAFDAECQHYYLPALLNFHQCELKQLTDFALVTKPLLLHTALMGLANQVIGRSERRQIEMKARLRRLYHHHGGQRGTPLWARQMVKASGYDVQALDGVLDRQRLAQQFYMQEGKVVAVKRGGFSYDPDDLGGELEMWSTLECPECGATEEIREQTAEEAIEAAEQFSHLSGPYCRCEQCDRVVRPIWEEAVDMPAKAYGYAGDNDEWEQYQEQLEYLLDEMKQELAKQGLPAPDGLRIEVSKFGWRRQDAYAECKYDAEELADKLRVNGEFNISRSAYTVEANGYASLYCVLSHHDGSSPIHVFPYWECEVDSSIHVYQEDWQAIREIWLPASELLLCGKDNAFPYTTSDKWTVATRQGLVDEFGSLVRNALFAEDDEDIQPFERAVRLLADSILEEINQEQPRAGFLSRVRQFRQVFDAWLLTGRTGSDGLAPFTVFCRQKDGKGTTWIRVVQAKDALHATEVALSECATDWDYPRDEIHVCGVAAGDIDLTWNDPEV